MEDHDKIIFLIYIIFYRLYMHVSIYIYIDLNVPNNSPIRADRFNVGTRVPCRGLDFKGNKTCDCIATSQTLYYIFIYLYFLPFFSSIYFPLFCCVLENGANQRASDISSLS